MTLFSELYYPAVKYLKLTNWLEQMPKQFIILLGEKSDCWCLKIFLHESWEEYAYPAKLQLINFDKFAGFSNDQTKMMVYFVQRVTEDRDYPL